MTPAHALITQTRVNNDGHQTAETPAQIAELLEVLIPREDPTMREALHVLDPEGNSLVWNAAIRGLDVALAYILSAEEVGRRRSMVNCVRARTGRSHLNGSSTSLGTVPSQPATPSGDNKEVSILEAVVLKTKTVRTELRDAENSGADSRLRRALAEKGNRLLRVRQILVANGAVVSPGPTMKWRIC
jgi:hypothetical protein